MERLEQLEQRARELGSAHEVELDGLDETAAAERALECLAQSELLGWCVPAAAGGADAGELASPEEVCVRAVCAIRRGLAYHSGMLDVVFVMQGLGSLALTRGSGGNAAAFAARLAAVVRGEQVAAFALTEPDAGSSLGDIAVRAERTAPDSSTWRLDGRKTFISNAGVADFYTVLARTSGEVGETSRDGTGCFSMFCVPRDAPGLECERFEVMAPHPIGDVVLRAVELDGAALIGEEGDGLAIALGVLGRFRTSVAAAATGFSRRAFDESCAHLKGRRQFGRPLAAFQGLAFDIAEMDTRLRAAELLVDEAAQAVDRGDDGAARAVARAKLFATESASWICDRAVQHHGGLGVKRGSVVERLFRDVRALRIYEGTSEVQKKILSKDLLS